MAKNKKIKTKKSSGQINAGLKKRSIPKHEIIPDSLRSILEVKNLTKYFGSKAAVKNASFSMKQGEIVGLLGPNGAGKTTIFYMIVGFINPTYGDIFMNSHKITNMQMFKRARLGINYLSQESSIFRKLTVEENIDAVLEILDISNGEKKRRKEEVLEDLE